MFADKVSHYLIRFFMGRILKNRTQIFISFGGDIRCP